MKLWLAIRAIVYGIGFIALWVWIALLVRRFDARLGFQLPSWSELVGWALAVAGAAVAVSCVAVFVHKGRGTPAPFDAPREFVASGPYRYVRNPMYIGGLGVMLGFGLALRSASIALLAVAASALMHAFVVRYEEPTLEKRFGAAYLSYKRSVRRWIPTRPDEGAS